MNQSIAAYHLEQSPDDQTICDFLYSTIMLSLPEAEHKIWHAHPVWFLDGNPVVGYHKLKSGIRLLFWSGQTFEEPLLKPEGKFKAAEFRFTSSAEIKELPLDRWLKMARDIQWDYQNIVKRKGELIRLK